MDSDAIDGYLLTGAPAKADAIATVLRERRPNESAAPFYRALEAVGVRAADEALIALRLVLAGKAPDDAAVRRLRGLAALATARNARDVAAAFAKAGPAVADLEPLRGDPAISAAARAAYHATF